MNQALIKQYYDSLGMAKINEIKKSSYKTKNSIFYTNTLQKIREKKYPTCKI